MLLKKLNKEKIKYIIMQQGLILAFIVLIVFISFSTDRFFTTDNIILIFRQVAIIGIIAIGMTYVLISGNIDLSVGSLVSLTAVVVVDLHDKIGPGPAIIVGLLIGVAVGALNGVFVGFLKMNPLIVTLGGLTALQGLTLIYTGGTYSVVADPDSTWYAFLGRGFVFGIPVPVIIFLGLALLFGILLTRTVYGRYVFAIGGNWKSSRFTGIRDNLIVFSVFILCSVMASTAGIVLGSRLMAAQNYVGMGYELRVIAAVVLGGTSLMGGAGSIPKTVIGALILGFIANGLIMLGYPYYVQWVVTWVIIIGAVWLDVLSKKKMMWSWP